MKFYRYAFALLLSIISFQSIPYQQNIAQILKRISNEQVQFVQCSFSDINGNLKEVTLRKEQMESGLQYGVSFDSSSIAGFGTIFDSDKLLKPDLNTFCILPWTTGKTKTAHLVCDIYSTENKPYKTDPRSILKTKLEEVHNLGFKLLIGVELEFFLVKKTNHGKIKPLDKKGYFDPETTLLMQEFKLNVLQTLKELGIPIEKIHHEVASGQIELSFFNDALTVADQLIIAKHVIKVLAKEMGLKATFMPKPFYGKNGSGMHTNFSLYDEKNKCNAFYDANDPCHLSLIAKQFIAGILKHIPAITALLNPSINSYKRLVPGYEAPIYICWGSKNRSAMTRIPYNRNQPSATRGEIRSPDPLCNPYLAFAALLSAGLDGINNQEKIPPSVEENLYHFNEKQLREHNIHSLPSSLDKALINLKESTLVRDFLGEQLLDEFINLKQKELDDYNTRITDWEIDKYL